LARKILLADDSVTAQNMGRKILADAGYDVITVNNGSAALKKIAELKPDLIVLDVYMPGYSGLEVCQRVKETGDTSRIPILLTVGKLEPFKPEEARRVRADGYIVKPFEASELLSALAKLEDKIVPRAETSKPGRFARTIAVVEEGRYDKTVSSGEDSGWKDRIGFPGKKKKEPESEDVDDSSIYNPVNKDLRTTIDRGTIDRRPAHMAQPEDTRVDLGALAPPGLPKDVTPEEIAALAAAAAQIKGTIGGAAETVASDSAAEPVASEQAAQPQVAAQPEAKAPETVQAKEEEKVEAAASEPKADALAESKAEGKIDPITEKLSEATAEAAASPSPADVAAAIAPLEAVTYLSANTSGASESRHSSDDPVTMAVAAGANGAAATPRWAAVATALLPEESTLSLEQEMQKAYAAFAAAEVAYAPSAVAVAEPPAVASPAESSTIESLMTAPASAAEFAPTESAAASEPAQLISSAVKNFEVAATATVEAQPAISPAPEAAPLQSVESKDAVSEQTPAIEARIVESGANESTATEPAVAASAPQDSSGAPAAALQTEQIQTEPIKAEQVSADALPAEQMPPSPASEEKAWGEQKNDEQKNQDQRLTEPRQEEARQTEPRLEETRSEGYPSLQGAEVAASAEISESIPTPNLAEPARFGDAPGEQSSISPSASQASSEPSEASSASVPVEARAEESVSQEVTPAEAAPKDPVHKESEIAATTAAAWASWRRIRETGDARSAAPSAAPAKNAESSKIEEERKDERKEEASERHEAAAMAVAAGAEKAPEAMPAADRDSDSGEIANIVDSVLADLRPKIVAEISKKMGKKK
jgi:CheY-like chemotaxis protein